MSPYCPPMWSLDSRICDETLLSWHSPKVKEVQVQGRLFQHPDHQQACVDTVLRSNGSLLLYKGVSPHNKGGAEAWYLGGRTPFWITEQAEACRQQRRFFPGMNHPPTASICPCSTLHALEVDQCRRPSADSL